MEFGFKMHRIALFVGFSYLILGTTNSVPLGVRSRWVIDEAAGGSRIKLTCVNWVSHLQPMVTEGLNRQPLSYITNTIASLGFNCVRLTWATFMFTDPAFRNLTVRDSLQSLNLTDAVDGISVSNPHLLDLTLIQAYQSVVAALGRAGVMVILDNHISKPQWCCGRTDGNGFFGDEYFDPNVWIEGLSTVATLFKDSPQVIAMSLRNELRGPKSNPNDWYRYMQRGAAAVHAANPNVLVILSGLNYDSDFRFLQSKRLNLGFTNKIVYEMHWYAFTDGRAWQQRNPNKLCGSVTSRINDRAAFLAKPSSAGGLPAAPLFISEFGIDQSAIDAGDNGYIHCFLAFAAEGDFDWALWTLQGSYYIRHGQPGFEETYGILNHRWDGLRNPGFLQRLKPIQLPIRDPNSSIGPFYQIIYHPASGLCVAVAARNGTLVMLDSCERSTTQWSYKGSHGGSIDLQGKAACIGAQGDGLPVVLTTQCSTTNNQWKLVSDSKLQIAVNYGFANNTRRTLCLEGNSSDRSILTKDCICLNNSSCTNGNHVEMQWFKVVTTNRKPNPK